MKSRTEAHKEFANLYRRPRSPEDQQKVDEIISKTNDIFMRIELINKLDAELKKGDPRKLDDYDSSSERSHEKRSFSEEDFKNLEKEQKKKDKEQKKEETLEERSFSIMGLWGRGNAVTRFGKESRTLEFGFLSRKPEISEFVSRIFRTLNEEQIVATLTALKYCEQVGWKKWEPPVFNTIVNFSRFFSSFISLDVLFRDKVSPEIFLAKSIKMQKYYARHINRENAKNIVLDNVIELVKETKRLSSKARDIAACLSFCLSLEERNPTLTNAICAFYVIKEKRIVNWTEIEAGLNVAPIDMERYIASPNIEKLIAIEALRLENQLKEKLYHIQESKDLKKRFFKINKDGKVDYSFLNQIIEDEVKHYYPDNTKVPETMSNIKSSPHILLQVILRDLYLSFFELFDGFVKILNTNGKEQEVKIFNPELYNLEKEKIKASVRNLDSFTRQYPNLTYSFQSFTRDRLQGSQDKLENQIVRYIAEASSTFAIMARKLHVNLQNHTEALKANEKEELTEKIINSKTKEIEDCKISARYIPYFDSILINTNRTNNYTVLQFIEELTRNLFNYALIFHEKSIYNELSSNKKIEGELDILYKRYKRFSGKEYPRPNLS